MAKNLISALGVQGFSFVRIMIRWLWMSYAQIKRRNNFVGFQTPKSILIEHQPQRIGRNFTHEFQYYGYRLSLELDDLKHESLYMKMAKELDRSILEKARSFVKDANARNKARLFMWKVNQLTKRGKPNTT